MKRPPSYETPALREFGEVLRGRRTIDQFLQMPVPEALVREAIEVATWAPNHYVTEPWRFIVPGDVTVARIIALCGEIVTAVKGTELAAHKMNSWREKPGWLVVTCPRNDDALREREDYAACCAAVQNFMLYLWKAGVGSKWTTGDITRDARFFDLLAVDGGKEFVVGMLWFGYPRITPTQARRDLDDVIDYLE